MNILIINGSNINMLGFRETEIYGTMKYDELCDELIEFCEEKEIDLEIFQTNFEGEIIELIHKSHEYDAVIINPGAFTHYSYSIYDAILCMDVPFVEVHLSDINNREEFRKISVVKTACVKTFLGKGIKSYFEAIDFIRGDLYGKA